MVKLSDFWATTSNKHFNLLLRVCATLQTKGTAAIVVPHNALFAWRRRAQCG